MPKEKTHKGMLKRFKVTASGKATARSSFRGHLLSHKPGKRKRQMRNDLILDNFQAKRVVEGLRPSM